MNLAFSAAIEPTSNYQRVNRRCSKRSQQRANQLSWCCCREAHWRSTGPTRMSARSFKPGIRAKKVARRSPMCSSAITTRPDDFRLPSTNRWTSYRRLKATQWTDGLIAFSKANRFILLAMDLAIRNSSIQPNVSSPTISPMDSVTVSATVENTGDREGDEVVQLYVTDVAASVRVPIRSLAGSRTCPPYTR